MPFFSPLVDQKRPARLLSAALYRGNLPHAFLFTGIDGIGKKSAAMALAMAGNCAHRPTGNTGSPKTLAAPDELHFCGKCPACKKILSGNHPDILLVAADGPIIKVDQVRTLCARLALKPYEADTRFAIIPDAHKLNPEAGNTLLKILEEPPGQTVFILTASQGSDILPTIVSRCQQIRFHPLSLESVQAYIQHTHDVGEETAAVMAAMAGGSTTRADAIAKSGWMARRNWIIDELEALPELPVNLCLAFSEILAKNKQWLFTAFELMKNWLRDTVVCQYAPHRIVNQDLLEQLSIKSKQADVKQLLQKIKAIEKAEKDIQSNANLRLTLDLLVLSLSKG